MSNVFHKSQKKVCFQNPHKVLNHDEGGNRSIEHFASPFRYYTPVMLAALNELCICYPLIRLLHCTEAVNRYLRQYRRDSLIHHYADTHHSISLSTTRSYGLEIC